MGLLSRSPKAVAQTSDAAIEAWVLRYGDLIFDLFQSLLQSERNAQILLREVFLTLRRSRPDELFSRYERAWVLRLACEKVRKTALTHAPRLSPDEQIELDSSADSKKRLARFDLYFRKLSIEDQILLLLKDKYGVPLPEVAAILGRAEESLKVQRSQALRLLEDWIWETA